MTTSDVRPGKGLGPFFLIAAVLVATSGILLCFTSKFWISVAVGWLGFGLLFYTLILRFFPPSPLLIKEKPQNLPEPGPGGRPFRIRDVPEIFFGLFLISAFAPFFAILLVPALIVRIRTSRQWRRLFPNASKAEIRDFLAVLLRSFDEPQPENFRLSPDDSLIHTYRAIYGPTAAPDKTVIENLANQLAQRYSVEVLNSLREDTTIGELFALIQRH